MSFHKSLVAALLVMSLAACGGGKNAAHQAASNQQNDQTSAPMAGMPASTPMQEAAGAQAPIPASLHCGAVAPVWVNMKTHVYHEPSDPYYGKTKHGEYLCPREAVAQGYHRAGAASMQSSGKHHKGSNTNSSGYGPAGEPTPSPE